MSIVNPDNPNTPGQVTLPAGWNAGPGRETTALDAAGQVVQGLQIPLSSAAGATATVFIPNQALAQGATAVQALIDGKIASISIIPGQV